MYCLLQPPFERLFNCRKTHFLTIALLFCFLTNFAQISGFNINNQSNRASFPFELINNLIVVKVVINDTNELNFILDTGVKVTLLTDNTITNFDLSKCRAVNIIGAGAMNFVEAFVVNQIHFELPGITSERLSLVVLKEDYLHLQNHLGMEIHGILGYDFFNQFVVKVDYVRKMITVYDPDTFKPKKSYTSGDIMIDHGRPYIQANIVQHNKSHVKAKLLIDTGASHAIMLETDSDSTISVPEKNVETIVGWGLGGELQGKLGRIDSLHIYGFNFSDVLCMFTSDFGMNILDKIPNRKGSIGGDILNRFSVIFDYQNNKVYFHRNSNFKKEFTSNMSGIDLIASGTNFKLFKVIHIIPDSPADQAGVKIDDIILSINGQMINEMTIQEVNGFFRSREKSKIKLIILRDQSIISTGFRLKKLI